MIGKDKRDSFNGDGAEDSVSVAAFRRRVRIARIGLEAMAADDGLFV